MSFAQPLFVAKKFALLAGLGLALLSLAACQPVQNTTGAAATEQTTSDATVAPANEATVTVNVSAAGINMPAAIPSGIVTFVFEMAEDAPGIPEFARLNDGVTMEQVMAAMQEDEMAALALVTMLGSSDTAADGQVVYDLPAGDYIGLLFPENDAPLTTAFTAGEASNAAEPVAAVTAQLADFAFILPDEIAAGPQTWLIENTGGQWHELLVLKLEEDVNVEDLLAMLASEEQSGPPPFEWVAGMSPMGSGQRAWVTWNLPAGEYTVICFLPDLAGDMAPHAAHGMVRTLIVQ